MTCCLDNDRREEIEEEILNLGNEQLENIYDRIQYWVWDAVLAKYVVKNRISDDIFTIACNQSDPDLDYDYNSDPDCIYDPIEDTYSLYD